jgi:hypothetical protein
LPVIPSVQAITSAKPDTAISGRNNGRDEGIGQSSFHRSRGDGELPKPVEAITGGDPNIAFTILKETLNKIARETVRPRKLIRPSLVHVQDSPVYRSDPQTVIAIPEQSDRL